MQIIRISFGLVNAYLIQGPDGDILVDTGLPGFSGRLRRALRPDRLRLIILTHSHFDHVANLHALRRGAPVPVLAHRLELPALQSGRPTVPAGQTPFARLFVGISRLLSPLTRIAPCTPEMLVEEDFDLSPFGIAGRVIHTPGHTAGSVSVLLASGDALVGDLCQNGWGFGMGLGRIRLPLADLPHALPGSWERLIQSGVKRLHPGHGLPFGVEALRSVCRKV